VTLKPTGSTMGGEVEDYRIAVRVPTIRLVKNVQAPYTGQVRALGADQWTLKAQQGNGGAGIPVVLHLAAHRAAGGLEVHSCLSCPHP